VPAIAAQLGVARSTVSLWVRDMPSPFGPAGPLRQRRLSKLGGAVLRRQSQLARQLTKFAAASEVDALSERELLLVGAALYWAEGSKDKPWRRGEVVSFINSDPRMIRVFLRWLALVGVEPSALRYRVQIHESADVTAAERFWAETARVPTERLSPSTLKRSLVSTTRRNTGSSYHGCLEVSVRGSSELYRKIEGWWFGIEFGCGALDTVTT
jgi:hypothetical protein